MGRIENINKALEKADGSLRDIEQALEEVALIVDQIEDDVDMAGEWAGDHFFVEVINNTDGRTTRVYEKMLQADALEIFNRLAKRPGLSNDIKLVEVMVHSTSKATRYHIIASQKGLNT